VFYRAAGAALSPGTVAELYGAGLASGSGSANGAPLPLNLHGTSILIGGFQAPLFYVSDHQVDLQIPVELSPGPRYQVLALVNGAVSLPQMLDIVGVQPAVDVSAEGILVAQHSADSSLVTKIDPAKPGETLVAYALGLGPTQPPVSSGAAAPANPPAQLVDLPQITIDNQPATVLFAGLSPGFVGLYQLNFVVPLTVSPGNLQVRIIQDGIAANTAVIPVGQ